MRYGIRQVAGNFTTNTRFNPIIRVSMIQFGDSSVIGTGISITGIYEDQTTVYSGFELVNWENIDVLHDALHSPTTTASVTATQQTGESVTVHKYIKGKKLTPVMYNDVSNAWQKGDILFCYYADSGSTPNCVLDAWIRVFFTDA